MQAYKQAMIAARVRELLADKDTAAARVQQTTRVQTAALHKERVVLKHTTATVTLFGNASADYTQKVQASAARLGNDAARVEQFTAQENYYAHTDCYSIVQHKQRADALYLYAIYSDARSNYTIDGVFASKQEVAELLTASAAKKLLQPSNITENATHGITHDVVVRTVALQNIDSIELL